MNDILNYLNSLPANYQVADWGYVDKLEPMSYDKFLKWVSEELQGPLTYLSDHRKEKRENLKEIYPECEGVLVFLFDYSMAKKFLQKNKMDKKIASYTLGFDGEDYHFWIGQKLELIGEKLKTFFPDLDYKISLDIHPVLERDFAYQAGLGWFGKNSMLINRKHGSYQLIGSLLLNKKLNLKSKNLEVDHCGNCTRCIDACPTSAILKGTRTLDAKKCISTFTIETFKDEEPPKGYPSQNHEVFGCDICQEVCPWNGKPLEKVEPNSLNSNLLVNFFNRDLKIIMEDLEVMSNKGFKTKFKNTSLERLGKKGLLKNLKYYLQT